MVAELSRSMPCLYKYQLLITNILITKIMITENELINTGFTLSDAIEDKDSPFDEEVNLRVETWTKQKNDLEIEVTSGFRRGCLEEPFWVKFEQSVALCLNGESQDFDITHINGLRLLLFALKIA